MNLGKKQVYRGKKQPKSHKGCKNLPESGYAQFSADQGKSKLTLIVFRDKSRISATNVNVAYFNVAYFFSQNIGVKYKISPPTYLFKASTAVN